MSFSLGGDGTFLPPRKNQQADNTGLGAGFRTPGGPSDRTPSGRVVQQSEPAFDEPGIKVRSGDQSVRLPIDTPKDVARIATRKPKSVAEAAQSAVAQASGVVIPLANFRDLKPRGDTQPAVPGRDATVTNLRTPGVARTKKAVVPAAVDPSGKSAEALCRLVFIVQAAKFGHALEYAGKTYSIEQVVSAAPKAAMTLDAALKTGKVSVDAIEACIRLYCQQNSCKLPSQTGTENVVDQPATTSVNTPPMLAPPVKDDPGTSITPFATSTPKLLQKEEPAAPAEKKSNALWWVLGLAAAALLVKKLAAVKVVGAAVAGAPLIAELDGDEDEDEGDEHDEEADHDGPPEARDTDEE